jgi:hypothetical protein
MEKLPAPEEKNGKQIVNTSYIIHKALGFELPEKVVRKQMKFV